jgi:hypothetical protein
MMPTALSMLAKARMQGAKPEIVMVDVGSTFQRDWWATAASVVSVSVPDDLPLREFDARPMIGCDVIVTAPEASDRLREIVRRICGVARVVTVLQGHDPDNLGFVWESGRGWFRFDEYRSLRAA